MQNIVLVTEESGYLVTSTLSKLEGMSYNVTTVGEDIDQISRIKNRAVAYLIFPDEELLRNPQTLTYVKDRAVEEDSFIFVIGDMDEVAGVMKSIPKHLVTREFYRPLNITEMAETVDEYIQKHGNQNKKKILVVDDSGAMLRNVKGWLEGKYNISLANSGAMAIKYLATNRPDLVLLDYEMPVCDGKMVLEMIRSETEFSDIPVIFLTGKGDKESVLDVMALKPEGYLLKSMPPEKIVQSIDAFFEKRRALL